MKKTILIIGLVIAVIAFSGCTQPEQPETVYNYVCSDGTIVDSPGLCPVQEQVDYEEVCKDYCVEEQVDDQPTVEFIKNEIETANYCETKEDCAETNTKCPIGCYNIVNTAELDRINGLIKDYKQTCFQTCATLRDYECDNNTNKCMPILYGTS